MAGDARRHNGHGYGMTALSVRQRNLTGGVLLGLAGAAAAVRALTAMHVGTPADMGPGFFPLVLGACLALCGVGMVLAALPDRRASGHQPIISLRVVGVVIVAVASFALTVRPLGLVPAAFLLVVIAGFADPRSRLKMILPLALGLSVLSWLIFLVGLKMPLPAFAF